MTAPEKVLYHQIHPAKLFTDWGAAAVALYFLWQHELVIALVVMFAPPLLASLAILLWDDLEKYKQSAFGGYVRRYMTRAMEAVRLAGMGVMALGAWSRTAWLIPAGLFVILFAWFRGIIFPVRRSE